MSRIAVIGGGIGGLAAALALLQRGFDVDVYEQSAELKEVGAGVQMGPNGTRVLNALGLEGPLAQVKYSPARREIRLGTRARRGTGSSSARPPSNVTGPSI